MALTLNLTKIRRTLANLYGRPSNVGAGTVTSVGAGADITGTPNPIIGTGTVAVTANTFIRADGTQPLTAAWDAGNFNATSRNSMPQFNMTEYGAIPNGVFDNTAVLTAILADMPAQGGVALVPNGTCYVASTFTFTKPVWFKGTTSGNSQIMVRGNGDGFVYAHNTGAVNNAVVLEDVSFLQAGAGGGTAGSIIRCASTVNFAIHINRCRFSNHFNGVSLESNWFSEITNSIFTGQDAVAGGSDIIIDNLVNMDQGGVRIFGCTFSGHPSYNVRQRAGGGTIITSNAFIPSAPVIYPIYLDIPAGKATSDLLIGSNNMEGNPSGGYIGLCPSGTYNGIQIYDNELAVDPGIAGIVVAPDATGFVAGLTISDNSFGNGAYAIYFDPAQVNGANIVKISGNQFNSQTVAAIRLPATASHVVNLLVGPNQLVSTGATDYISGSFSASSGFDNLYVGTGTTSATTGYPWDAPVTINQNAAAPAASGAGTLVHLVGADGVMNNVELDAYAASTVFTGRMANGTGAAPSAIDGARPILSIASKGYGSTGFSSGNRGGMNIGAANTWTDASQGTIVQFYTTPVGSTTVAERVRVQSTGNVSVGTVADTGSKVLVNGTVELVNGSGGGYKFADGSVQTTAVGTGGACPSSRLINTTAPLAGGGNLTADRTLTLAVTPANPGGAIALQAATPGTQQGPRTSTWTGRSSPVQVFRSAWRPVGTPTSSVRKDQNATTDLSVENENNGATALAQFDLQSDTANADLSFTRPDTRAPGLVRRAAAGLIANTNATGGLSLAAQAAAAIRFYTGGVAAGKLRVSIGATGIVNVANLPAYASNALALLGGLVAGDLYTVTASDPRVVAVVF